MATKSPSTKTTKPKQLKAPTHDEIQHRAYEIAQSTGNGDPIGNWLEAERELVAAAMAKPRRRKAAQ